MDPSHLQCLVAAILAAGLEPQSAEDAVDKYRLVVKELRRTGGVLKVEWEEPEAPA